MLGFELKEGSLMTYIICEELALPIITSMLQEFHFNKGDVAEFISRTIEGAEKEGFALRTETNKVNSRTTALTFTLQSRLLGEIARINLLSNTQFLSDFNTDDDEFEGWGAICLMMFFASDKILDEMITSIPINKIAALIAVMEPATAKLAKAKYLQ